MRNTQCESWSLRRDFLWRDATNVASLEGVLVSAQCLLNTKEEDCITVAHVRTFRFQI